MEQIYDWLLEEGERNVPGNFLCNWRLTRKSHEEGELLVLIDEIEDIPVAYQWGRLLRPGILQVRNDWRRKGLGRLIVEYCVEVALQRDEMVLQVECKPSSSIPFWKTMGFRIFEAEFEENATGFRVLSKKLALPHNGKSISTKISLFNEERMWNEDAEVLKSCFPKAIDTNDGKVYLAERVTFPNFFQYGSSDAVIEIVVEDKLVYRDKARYLDALKHGIKPCVNGFFIDVITF